MARSRLSRVRGWDVMLFALLAIIVTWNAIDTPGYASVQNQVNLLQLGIERSIVVLAMAFIIISGEIDLSVASVMALSGAVAAGLFERGVSMEIGILAALAVGVFCGLFNGFWVAVVGLPSLAVTLATLIGFRGVATMLIEDRSIGDFPQWFDTMGQSSIVGPFTFSILLYVVLVIAAAVLLHLTGFGRITYVIGNSKDVARFSGVRVAWQRIRIFMMSGTIAALAGVLYTARLGSARASTAEGFELDIITVVLLGGVSIFGGSGSMLGVVLSTFLVLNLRNGLSLAGIDGNTQTGIIGALLILSVLLPNMLAGAQDRRRRRTAARAGPDGPAPPTLEQPGAAAAT
jgi:rhamnose transport system permease protein